MKPWLLALLVLCGSLAAQLPNELCGPEIAMPAALQFLRNQDFESSMAVADSSLASQFPKETEQLRAVFLETPSYQFFFPGPIPMGTSYREIFSKIREGRNALGTKLGRIADKLEKKQRGFEGEHRKRRNRDPQIPLQIQRYKKAHAHFQAFADSFTVTARESESGIHANHYRDFMEAMEKFGDFRWESGTPLVPANAMSDQIRLVYSIWGEIRAALVVPNLRAINVLVGRYARTGDFISTNTLRALSSAEAGYEIDLVFRDEQNRVCWGEVKAYSAILDGKGPQWERVNASLEKAGRISRALGIDAQLHLFLINGIRKSQRTELEARGVTVWGPTFP